MKIARSKTRKSLIMLSITITLCFFPNLGFAWSSSGGNNVNTNTHFWILDSAIDILQQNEGHEVSSNEIMLLNKWKEFLGYGISFADYNAGLNSAFSYGSHFYDPDTGKSFIPTKTAKDMGAHYFYKAGTTYKQNHPLRAFYYLGLSLHYLTDITQPMHAANLTDFNLKAPLYHSRFERFAASLHKNYKVTDGQGYWDWQKPDPAEWIHVAAKEAKKDISKIYNRDIVYWVWKSSYSYAYTRRWKDAAVPVIEGRLQEAQRITAGYIHLWFKTYT